MAEERFNSYDSGNLTLDANGNPITQNYMGNLGSNGNVNTAANTGINGTFASPDTGVGACSSRGVTALSGNTTSVTGCGTSPTSCLAAPGLVKLPQAAALFTTQVPSTVPPPQLYVTNSDIQ